MNKPGSLRAALKAALDSRHALATDPNNLIMVMTNGRPIADMRPGRSFEWKYQLELTFLGFTGGPMEITVPLMLWIQRWQSQLLASPEAAASGIRMTVEMLADKTCDVHLELQLTEFVRFAPRPDGGHDLVMIEEPLPMALEEAEPLNAVYLDGELIFETQV